jgi:hypothetical protein
MEADASGNIRCVCTQQTPNNAPSAIDNKEN